ncbi:hypothetical protein Pint_07241 [Pistacia integerrima]|uniref:Uncharacterized protein n=1 Tax=Pistacia integerrima TaxID=434235 RepID=A0ACC0XVH7_9ROSI|nr:hypothetical protein Pint_07241 [Pistacia integerrima]
MIKFAVMSQTVLNIVVNAVTRKLSCSSASTFMNLKKVLKLLMQAKKRGQWFHGSSSQFPQHGPLFFFYVNIRTLKSFDTLIISY